MYRLFIIRAPRAFEPDLLRPGESPCRDGRSRFIVEWTCG